MNKLAMLFALIIISFTTTASATGYDIALNNGRVMDPETQYDDIANIGIKEGTIVVFDAETIADKGTYTDPNQPADEVQSVLVNGVAVVADGKLAEDAAPGKPIRRAVAEKMDAVKCPEVRPEMCTMDYNPVCGSLSDGSFKTYSNGCGACSDRNVKSFTPGECK